MKWEGLARVRIVIRKDEAVVSHKSIKIHPTLFLWLLFYTLHGFWIWKLEAKRQSTWIWWQYERHRTAVGMPSPHVATSCALDKQLLLLWLCQCPNRMTTPSISQTFSPVALKIMTNYWLMLIVLHLCWAFYLSTLSQTVSYIPRKVTPESHPIWNVLLVSWEERKGEGGKVNTAFTPWFSVKWNCCQHVSLDNFLSRFRI